jgi:hypothetical protein
VRVTSDQVEEIGRWPQIWRIDPVPDLSDLVPLDNTYYSTTLESIIDVWLGLDGTNVTVAQYEGTFPDSWQQLSGAPSGSCVDVWGLSKKCHCPAGDFHLDPGRATHVRYTLGVVRRTTGILGMANGATTLAANHMGGCSSYGPDNYASAMHWAYLNGATVMGHSECTGTGMSQTAHDRFFDYMASTYYLTIASAAGNSDIQYVCNKRRNTFVVGGGREVPGNPDRAQVTWDNVSYYNPGNYPPPVNGWELPHLTAISANVNSAGSLPSGEVTTGGTSMAAPEVAGIAASIIEGNPPLQAWPEVMIPGLMASADANTDGIVLNLHDGVDDRDGAGLVNAWQAWLVLQPSSHVNGGNAPIRGGHDYGYISASSTPAYSFYNESYVARVPNGSQVRVVSFLQARPNCPGNPGFGDCSSDPYPYSALFVYDGANLVAVAFSADNNYQYVAFTNTSGIQKDYTVKMYLSDWNGLASTTFGIAWSSW